MKVEVIEFASYAYESLTVANVALALTLSKYAQPGGYAIKAFITLEDAQVRWRIDGTNPTATEGHLLDAGQNLSLESAEAVRQFKAIRTGDVSGVIKVSYLKG